MECVLDRVWCVVVVCWCCGGVGRWSVCLGRGGVWCVLSVEVVRFWFFWGWMWGGCGFFLGGGG